MRLFVSLYKHRHAAAACMVNARFWSRLWTCVKNWNWTAVATCVIAIATVAAAYVSRLQWTAIREQLGVMRDAFTATQRPWVSNDAKPTISSALFHNPNGDISLSLHFQFKNSGKTPAILVAPDI